MDLSPILRENTFSLTLKTRTFQASDKKEWRVQEPQSVDEKEELQEVVIRALSSGRLDDVDVLAPDALLQLDLRLAVGELAEDDLADPGPDLPGDQLRHFRMRGAAEDLEGAGPGAKFGATHFRNETWKLFFRGKKGFFENSGKVSEQNFGAP